MGAIGWLLRARRAKRRRAAYVPGLLAVGAWWYLLRHKHEWHKTAADTKWGDEYHGCCFCGKKTYKDVETFVPRLWPSFKDKTLVELDAMMRTAL